MIATDTFSAFGRRLAATQGYANIIIAETPNPIQDLGPEALYARAEKMMSTIVEGLTLPRAELELRMRDMVKQTLHPAGMVRASA